jgi:hypothetical protein
MIYQFDMASNRCFEISIPNANMTQIYDIVLGDSSYQVTNVAGDKMIVKLPEGDNSNYGILNSATELTLEEARARTFEVGWKNNNVI